MITMNIQSNMRSARLNDQALLEAYAVAFAKAAAMLLGGTVDIIAVKTGAMRQSLDVDMSRDSHEVIVDIGYDGTVDYDLIHEFWPRSFYKNPTTPGTVPHAMQNAADKISFEEVVKALVDVELLKAAHGGL